MSSNTQTLDHFYYGQIVKNGQPDGPMRLLSRSDGITSDLAKSAVERIKLPPLIKSDNASWALVRGNRQLPYVMTQAQVGGNSETMMHYILFPPDILRSIGGDIRFLSQFVDENMPSYESHGHKLAPLQIKEQTPVTSEQEIDDMLDLMTNTKNQINTIEHLLAAIVQGVEIVIQGAPSDLNKRTGFIAGILALLPPSVRFAVTFATHSLPTTEIDTRVRFYSDDAPPKNTLVYNWGAARLTGQIPEDEYSRFIVSQLRLDTELVIESTRALTTATGWRMRQGDRLAQALAYGSHRRKIDEALMNNQPVSKDDVAEAMREDPTLSDNLRSKYASHLLKFSIAMNAVEEADPIMDLLPDNPKLEQASLAELGSAVEEQPSVASYRLLSRWIGSDVALKDQKQWQGLAQQAAVNLIDDLTTKRAIDHLNNFIKDLQASSPDVGLSGIMGQIIEKTLPLTPQDPSLAENVFLLAADYLPVQAFQRLMGMKPFIERLHPQVSLLWAHLSGNEIHLPQKGLIAETARLFGEYWEPVVMVRFAELARNRGHLNLLDEVTLNRITQYLLTGENPQHQDRIAFVAGNLGSDDLSALGRERAYLMLRLKLALGDFKELASMLLQQSTLFYPGDLQLKYILMIERLFAETPIDNAQIPRALTEIHLNGIRSAPLVMASIGALKDREPEASLTRIAGQVEDTILDQPRLLQVIPPTSLLNLLDYYARSEDVDATLRIAEMILIAAGHQNVDTLSIAGQMYRAMEKQTNIQEAALDTLRVFVRGSEQQEARQAIAYFGRELGKDVRGVLEATYVISRITGDLTLDDYTESIRVTTRLLYDTASSYSDRNAPALSDLQQGLEAMSGRLSREEMRALGRGLLALAQNLVQLAAQHRANHTRNVDRLVQGNVDPTSILDVMRVMGGHFTGGKRAAFKLGPYVPYPLGNRSLRTVFEEVRTASVIFSTLLRAVPSSGTLSLKSDDIAAEMQSLSNTVTPEAYQTVRTVLGQDLNRLVDLIDHIATSGDPRILENSNIAKRIDSGKQRPRNTLELYRYLYAYFSTKV